MIEPLRKTDRWLALRGLRPRFDDIYTKNIVGGGFVESDQYYKIERERYWRSLQFLAELDFSSSASVLEIGGGQTALLCKKLFGNDVSVGDVTTNYRMPLEKAGINFFEFSLMSEAPPPPQFCNRFDVLLLLEVIEHIPIPGYIVIERVKPFLKDGGILFLTTPNLFRIRNLIRMFIGKEFLDRFMLPESGQGLGHQLEYSEDHLRWQIQRAGMTLLSLQYDNLGRKGHSAKTRLAHWAVAPLRLREIWKENLVAAARKPA